MHAVTAFIAVTVFYNSWCDAVSRGCVQVFFVLGCSLAAVVLSADTLHEFYRGRLQIESAILAGGKLLELLALRRCAVSGTNKNNK